MKEKKILEVNNIDLIGNRFNGYDMIEKLSDKYTKIKQAVIVKQSDNDKVVRIMNQNSEFEINEKMRKIEEDLSIKNVFSITSPLLRNMKEYKEADIIHFHMFHNTDLSLYSLKKICEEKKVILSLHDPWFLTGHCVHFYDCDKWKNGCVKCDNLNSLFSIKEDNCHDMWELKKNIFDNLDIDLVVSTPWMYNLVKESPITKKNDRVHLIPFGVNYKLFQSISYENARKHYQLDKNSIVLFLRAQNEFKGTPYILEALKKLNTNKKLTILTCDNKGLLDDIKNKYKVIDLGPIQDQEMIYAMNACDIFLMPSIGESFGMMAIEAMACSKPVIIFNNSALPSVTHAPECGYLVNNRDAEDLRKAIQYLIEHSKEREERGKLGAKIVEEEYSNESYYGKLKDLYDAIDKKAKKKIERKEEKPTANAEQFKFYLNDFTVRIFGTKHKCTKELWLNTKGIKRERNYSFIYSDLTLQEILNKYCEKLAKCLLDNPIIYNGKKVKIQKMIYFLKNNPQQFLRMIRK